MEYEVIDEGFANGATGTMISLILASGVSTVLLILTSVLGGKAYSLTAADIAAISDEGIKNNITAAVTNGFIAQNQTASYLPLIVLSVVMGVVLFIVLSVGRVSSGSSGSAL